MPAERSNSRGRTAIRFLILRGLTCAALVCLGFLLGLNYGFYHGCVLKQDKNTVEETNFQPINRGLESCKAEKRELQNKVANLELQNRVATLEKELAESKINSTRSNNPQGCPPSSKNSSPRKLFSSSVKDFVQGAAYMERNAFNHQFDMGFPLDATSPTNDRVLILYSNEASFPPDYSTENSNSQHTTEDDIIPTFNVSQATQNCNYLNVVLLQPRQQKQCTAIMGQFASHHIPKWMRLPNNAENGKESYGPMDPKVPLQLVNRGAHESGRKSMRVPTKETNLYWSNSLKRYLNTLDTVLEELRPIAAQVAQANTIIVTVANHGQSELLMNFVCSSRARGLDISSLLVFATDQETKDLAEGLGVTVFFDQTVRGKQTTQKDGHGLVQLAIMACHGIFMYTINLRTHIIDFFLLELWRYAKRSCRAVCGQNICIHDAGKGRQRLCVNACLFPLSSSNLLA